LNIHGIIGPFIDQESILSFKNFLNKLGSSNYYFQDSRNFLNFRNVNIDHRFNYLLTWNETLEKLNNEKKKPDFLLIIGNNPRFEASTFNVRLRKLALQNIPVAYIGEPMNLTYPSHHIGNNTQDLISFCQGKDV
jgi:hypothetical protein